MKLYLFGHDYRYAAEQIMLTIFPGEKPEYPDGQPSGDRAEIRLSEGKSYISAFCTLHVKGKAFRGRAAVVKDKITDDIVRDRLLQRIVKLSFYRAALASGEPRPKWGALTGIRPGKLLSNRLESGLSDRAAMSSFMKDNDVSRERAELCLHTAHAGLRCAQSLESRDICLYVGIPFCPTRCSYCSFVSQSVAKSMNLIPPFLETLYSEIDATAKAVSELSLRPVALYMGGGTPTTLTAEQLDSLLTRLYEAFDLSALRESTVEAGRPDTITEEKMRVLKEHGVTRVSVNPQSMDDRVLEAIGRKHTAEDVVRALEKVRRVANFEINMDLIAGLPLDTPETFRHTLDRVLELSPDNITIHTLALKKGSRIMLGDLARPSAGEVGQMLDYANPTLFSAGYKPYYLYRQKYMSGGFENVGWQRGDTPGIYNICIMEELCSIIAMGGGASTKICLGGGRIERLFDPKYPKEYIESIDRIIDEKSRLKEYFNVI